MALIARPESGGDSDAVYAVHRAAFGRDLEAGLYARLVADGDWLPASRVGVLDGAVVASVVVSRAHVGERPVAAFGPVGVLPGHQGQGHGSALVRAALAACADEPLVALLGSPAYYGRFGFAPDPRVPPPDPRWGGHFQVVRNDPAVEGPFRYAAAFDVT